MKWIAAFLITFALAFIFGALSVVADNPLLDAAASAIAPTPPDPYQQLLDARAAEGSSVPLFVAAALMGVVLVGIGWYALSERTTKTLRAFNTARRPVRTRRVQPLQQDQYQPAQFQPIQPIALPEVSEV
jgi:hypothetical protein